MTEFTEANGDCEDEDDDALPQFDSAAIANDSLMGGAGFHDEHNDGFQDEVVFDDGNSEWVDEDGGNNNNTIMAVFYRR